MSDPSFDSAASNKWARENPHWILFAQIVFWGVLGWFFISPFFGEPTYTDYEIRNLPYEEHRIDNCYHPLDC